MKTKRKIMAIWMVFLITIIPFSIAEADNALHTAHENILVELGATDSNGIFTTEKLYVTEQELLEFEGIIGEIIDKILSTNGLKDINGIFNDIPLLRNSKFLNIFKNMFKLGNLKNRAVVVSSGHDRNFNIIKKSSIKIRNKLRPVPPEPLQEVSRRLRLRVSALFLQVNADVRSTDQRIPYPYRGTSPL